MTKRFNRIPFLMLLITVFSSQSAIAASAIAVVSGHYDNPQVAADLNSVSEAEKQALAACRKDAPNRKKKETCKIIYSTKYNVIAISMGIDRNGVKQFGYAADNKFDSAKRAAFEKCQSEFAKCDFSKIEVYGAEIWPRNIIYDPSHNNQNEGSLMMDATDSYLKR